ncbi:hypothetical protein K7X08_018772 [Anisodus acutangulus]|uniref:Uncharacterized protein n=1 Tax=Anisodus acutangulus TaxID=402998 RepID=A0A9Q1LXK7_9SOLA|nr:hypothetical protein K7X08_018772 [Anisodus acutangulus]
MILLSLLSSPPRTAVEAMAKSIDIKSDLSLRRDPPPATKQTSLSASSNSFTKIIKEKVGETSTLRNEVDDGDMERNTTTNGEEASEDNDVNLLKTISEKQLLKTYRNSWRNKKKKEYMILVSKTVYWQIHRMPIEQMQQGVRKNMQAEINVVVRAVVARILGFTPQPPPDGSGSPLNKS